MKEIYDNARIAARNKADAQAQLQLGVCYAEGIGTRKNHTLACYFFEKARALGSEEAAAYLDQEYDLGTKDITLEIKAAFEDPDHISDAAMTRFRQRLEKERQQHNYGVLAQLRELLPHFYPTYTAERAIDDIVHERDSVEADLFYATATDDNRHEVATSALEHFLQQLYAPILRDHALCRTLAEAEVGSLMTYNEKELLMSLQNLTSMYDNACARHGIRQQTILRNADITYVPYIPLPTLCLLRRQAVRMLLSLRDIDAPTFETYMSALGNDMRLLEICELFRDRDLQMFTIYFVELNVNIGMVEEEYHQLFTFIREGRFEDLARRLNDFANSLNELGIQHQLPEFTTQTLSDGYFATINHVDTR